MPSVPPPASPSRTQRLTELATGLSKTMGIARALAQSGRTLDLTGIDNGIGVLCAQALDLPLQDGRALLPVLRDVLGQVDALTTTLRAVEGRPPAQ